MFEPEAYTPARGSKLVWGREGESWPRDGLYLLFSLIVCLSIGGVWCFGEVGSELTEANHRQGMGNSTI
jgi:hypothetical protein